MIEVAGVFVQLQLATKLEYYFEALTQRILRDHGSFGRLTSKLTPLEMLPSGFFTVTVALPALVSSVAGISAYPIVEHHTWLAGMTEDGKILGRVEPVEDKTTLICPGPIGGKSWNQVAYSERTGFMYTPSLEICSHYISREQEAVEGRSFLGGTWSFAPPLTDLPIATSTPTIPLRASVSGQYDTSTHCSRQC